MDTSTGELKEFPNEQALKAAQQINPNLVEISRQLHEEFEKIGPSERLSAYAAIAGNNKSKQRRAKKLSKNLKRIAESSRRRNR